MRAQTATCVIIGGVGHTEALAEINDGAARTGSSVEMEFHVDPLFVHRQLAAQALGVVQDAPIGQLADLITGELVARRVPDLRLAAIHRSLTTLADQIVTVRAGTYFRYEQGVDGEVGYFHQKVRVDEGLDMRFEGRFSAGRFEATSPRDNLTGQVNVFIAGVVTEVDAATQGVQIRPLLIGFPYFVPAGATRDMVLTPRRLELHCRDVDQFHLSAEDLATLPTNDEMKRLFLMSEPQVKQAFASILGVKTVPADWGGENSDLVADISIDGVAGRAAFAFKGPGGRKTVWRLNPAQMGKNGDQAVRLFSEPADVMVVQHCGPIAEAVRHIMEALAVQHQRRYMLLPSEHTVRILKKAGLLA